MPDAGTRISHRHVGILQLTVVLISNTVEAADRLVVARAVPALFFAKPRMHDSRAVALGQAGIAVGDAVRATDRHVDLRAGAHVAGAFGDGLDTLLKAMHKGTRHIGKAPKRFSDSRRFINRIDDLKHRLRIAIADEDYEEAGELHKLEVRGGEHHPAEHNCRPITWIRCCRTDPDLIATWRVISFRSLKPSWQKQKAIP